MAREPKRIWLTVKAVAGPAVMVNSKNALPLAAVFNAPMRAAAPALKFALWPTYVFAAGTEPLVSIVVVPLLFPWDTGPTVVLDNVFVVGVAMPAATPKFQYTDGSTPAQIQPAVI